ncbi:MAG: pilus assembly PilX N-terminal domain-containing protein [Candidatus Pacebacteria bacterium]|nr:pilus assembly PilX N-terminal domain-containing protein [Candidatus Paceibacterota bacterium]
MMNKKIVQGKIQAIKKNSKKEGSALIMTVLLLSSMIAVVFIFTDFINASLESSKSSQDSIQSYYAAEAGIEKFLYNTLVNDTELPSELGEIDSDSFDSGASYSVRSVQLSPTRIKSFGSYNGFSRSVELDF